jgi:hypothetical protein
MHRGLHGVFHIVGPASSESTPGNREDERIEPEGETVGRVAISRHSSGNITGAVVRWTLTDDHGAPLSRQNDSIEASSKGGEGELR